MCLRNKLDIMIHTKSTCKIDHNISCTKSAKQLILPFFYYLIEICPIIYPDQSCSQEYDWCKSDILKQKFFSISKLPVILLCSYGQVCCMQMYHINKPARL